MPPAKATGQDCSPSAGGGPARPGSAGLAQLPSHPPTGSHLPRGQDRHARLLQTEAPVSGRPRLSQPRAGPWCPGLGGGTGRLCRPPRLPRGWEGRGQSALPVRPRWPLTQASSQTPLLAQSSGPTSKHHLEPSPEGTVSRRTTQAPGPVQMAAPVLFTAQAKEPRSLPRRLQRNLVCSVNRPRTDTRTQPRPPLRSRPAPAAARTPTPHRGS